MGAWLGRVSPWNWWSTPEPEGYDEPDNATGLTPRQKDAIRTTWATVKCDAKVNGIGIFLKLFRRYPEYQQLFKSFANVPLEELPRNGRLAAHATSVVYALTSVVDHLEDPECLVELLMKIAVSHKVRNITRKHFQVVEEIILELLEEKLGKNVYNDFVKDAWRKTLHRMTDIIVKELESDENIEGSSRIA